MTPLEKPSKIETVSSPKAPPARPLESAVAAEKEATDAIQEWMSSVGDGQPFDVAISRVSPSNWKGHNVEGHLDTISELPTEALIRERWGGGKFQLRMRTQDKDGRMKYAGSKTIRIAGDPVVSPELHDSDEPTVVVSGPKESETLISKSMDMMRHVADQERRRADEASKSNGKDDRALKIMENLLASKDAALEAQNRRLEALQEKMDNLINKKPDTTLQDKVLDSLVNNKTAEMMQIRQQFESERNMLITSHNDEIKRLHDRYSRDFDSMREDFKRQIHSLEESAKRENHLLTTQMENTKALLERQILAIEKEKDSLQKELKDLRATKEKSPLDLIQEMGSLKEGLETLTGGSGGDESTAERIFNKITESPLLQGIGQRLAGPPPMPPQAQLAAAQAAEAAAVGQQMEKVIQFIEVAIENGTDPTMFARSAASMVDNGLLNQIIAAGDEAFVQAVTEAKPGSSIATPGGKRFIKQVMAILSGGTAGGSA